MLAMFLFRSYGSGLTVLYYQLVQSISFWGYHAEGTLSKCLMVAMRLTSETTRVVLSSCLVVIKRNAALN